MGGTRRVTVGLGWTVILLALFVSIPQASWGQPEVPFIRGDVDEDRRFRVTDALVVLQALFLGGPGTEVCADAADINDDGKLNVSDCVFLLSYLFRGGPPPPPPFQDRRGLWPGR